MPEGLRVLPADFQDLANPRASVCGSRTTVSFKALITDLYLPFQHADAINTLGLELQCRIDSLRFSTASFPHWPNRSSPARGVAESGRLYAVDLVTACRLLSQNRLVSDREGELLSDAVAWRARGPDQRCPGHRQTFGLTGPLLGFRPLPPCPGIGGFVRRRWPRSRSSASSSRVSFPNKPSIIHRWITMG